jgi:hypothetical protein
LDGCAGELVSGRTGDQEDWRSGGLEIRSTGDQEHWRSGGLEIRRTGDQGADDCWLLLFRLFWFGLRLKLLFGGVVAISRRGYLSFRATRKLRQTCTVKSGSRALGDYSKVPGKVAEKQVRMRRR